MDNEKNVCEVLGSIGRAPVYTSVEALGGNYWPLRRPLRKHAADTLGETGDKRIMANEKNVDGVLGSKGRAPVSASVEDLRSNDWLLRKRAADTLGEIGDKRVVMPLIKALRDEVRGVRKAAADALVKIGEDAVPKLIKILWGKRMVVRKKAAAYALEKIGTPEALDAVEIFRERHEFKSEHMEKRKGKGLCLTDSGLRSVSEERARRDQVARTTTAIGRMRNFRKITNAIQKLRKAALSVRKLKVRVR